tara:strand:- start:12 stop:464 length:453 start_codon:yes stop_codon:yes gene_type:complete
MIKKAKKSNNRKQRYSLTRVWDLNKPKLLYILYNPSVADEQIDDPTTRRLISFTKKFDYGGFFVVNLFTEISSNPKIINTTKGITNKNLKIIKKLSLIADKVIYAWGANCDEPKIFKNLIFTPLCFGLNKNGSPKHPLYLKSDTQLKDYR